jgi:putative peptide zinc metalloprotease protein
VKSRILILLASAVAATGLAGARPAVAAADGGDNTAIAVNTTNGSTLIKVAFAIRHVMGNVVDQGNAAVAYASCTDCTTVAVAIEIVLVEGNPSVVTPTNIALAYNELCSLCVTVADAMQFVEGTGGPVHFDAEGNKILAQIRQELESLKHQTLTLDELQAKIDQIRAQIVDVLQNHLVPAGKPEQPPAPPPPPTTTTQPTTSTGTTSTETTTTTTPTTTPVTTTSGP